ncbi:diacylglycerol kinase family protein [Pontibacter liquoris]|uniref:diacylglycerol kinase family protein n=1 Tax=Pontibacter liquoris TaxID=2905677 RepID=UPI001FA76AE5|nr:diacylglycerol kinase family protein [Pontibacter liquoris]
MPQPSYFLSRYNSVKYALKGITAVFRSEPNMRLHVLASVVVGVMGFRFGVTRTEWCFLLLSIGLVWMAEIVNTAIETLTNLVSPEFHALAGKTKDLAAGAVLMAAITAAGVGLVVFVPYWLAYLNS